jgi:outer membrane protein assembly factor BamB
MVWCDTMGRLAAGRGRATDAAIIPQHIVAHTPWTYVLLLCLALGACPYTAFARQLDTKPPAPPPAPLLPAEEAWNVSLPSPAAAQGALDGLRIYIPLESGQLIALDRETGADEWSVEFSSSWPPIVSNGVVYVAGAGQFQAVGAERGDLLWRTSLDAELMTGPVLQGDSIVVHLKPGQLIALRTADGSEKWRTTIEERVGSPAMAADATGVVVSSGARLSRFATGNGELEWTRELAGVLGRPVVAGDRVFVGSTDNYLYAIEVTTGRVAWRYPAGGDVVGAVADARFVYFASLDNLLRALRRGSGNQQWKRSLSTRTIAPPSTFGGVVVVTGNKPTLSTFNASTGQPIASYSVPADLQGLPLVDATLEPFRVAVIAVTRDARAIALRPTGMMFRELPATPLQSLPGRPLNREPLTPPAAGASDPSHQPPSDGANSQRVN